MHKYLFFLTFLLAFTTQSHSTSLICKVDGKYTSQHKDESYPTAFVTVEITNNNNKLRIEISGDRPEYRQSFTVGNGGGIVFSNYSTPQKYIMTWKESSDTYALLELDRQTGFISVKYFWAVPRIGKALIEYAGTCTRASIQGNKF